MSKHMTWTTRLQIEKLFNAGATYREIASAVGYAVSSVYREVQRGLYDHLDSKTWLTVKKYSAQIADDDAVFKATSHGCTIKLDHNYNYAETVLTRITAGESPDAITGDLKRNNLWTVSTSTLYRYIDAGYIPGVTNKSLIRKFSQRRNFKHPRAVKAPNGKSIEHRPSDINNRSDFGHWELDSIIGKSQGKNQSVLTLVERKTRYLIIAKVPSKSASAVVNALSKIVSQYPENTFKTITVDNGSEFADYSNMKKYVNEVYYCHPYCSCERGSNENINGLVRRYFKKGESLAHVTQTNCDAVANCINNMHRKILDYKTANECFALWQMALVS